MTQSIVFCASCGNPMRDPNNPDSPGANKLVQLNDLDVFVGGQRVKAEGHLCDECYEAIGEVFGFDVQNSSNGIAAMEGLLSARTIKDKLDEHVMGQEVAKKIIATAAATHLLTSEHNKNASDDEIIGKSNILMYGPTGCGKTHIVNILARILGKDLLKQDASKFTSAGYVGDNVEDIIQRLFNLCKHDAERTQSAIVFIDEIDKIASASGDIGGKDVNGRATQQALLTILEGGTVEVKIPSDNPMTAPQIVPIDTSGILFICAGSFAGIEQIVERRLGTNKKPMGFKAGSDSDQEEEAFNLHAEIRKEDLFAFGMIPELVGRLPKRGHLTALDVETLRRILTDPPNSKLKQCLRLFELAGTPLTMEDEALTTIAKFAESQGTGARELDGIIDHIVLDYEFELDPSGEEEGEPITITAEYVKEQLKSYTSGKLEEDEDA